MLKKSTKRNFYAKAVTRIRPKVIPDKRKKLIEKQIKKEKNASN